MYLIHEIIIVVMIHLLQIIVQMLAHSFPSHWLILFQLLIAHTFEIDETRR